jgi:acyl carrier protein
VSTLFDAGESAQVSPDEPLVGSLVDSIDVLNLILFIEDGYGIRIEDDEVTLDNFATISALATLVSRKLADSGRSLDSRPQPATDG